MPVLYKEYNISKDPEQHGIGGASSGAIAAFTVAWERPNEFRKILSIVGSFTNIRGGHAYADIVAKSEKKPIRIFLQDGRNDNRALQCKRHLRRNTGLVLSECSPHGSPDEKRLRSKLRLGNEPARPGHGRCDHAGNDAMAVERSAGFNRSAE